EGASGGGVDAAEEPRRDPPNQPVAAGRADDDQDHHRRRPHPRPVAGEEVPAPVVDDEGGGDRQQRGQQPTQRAPRRASLQLVAEPGLLPGVSAGLEELAGQPPAWSWHQKRGYPASSAGNDRFARLGHGYRLA